MWYGGHGLSPLWAINLKAQFDHALKTMSKEGVPFPYRDVPSPAAMALRLVDDTRLVGKHAWQAEQHMWSTELARDVEAQRQSNLAALITGM